MGVGVKFISLGAHDSPTKISGGDGQPSVETPYPGIAVLLVGIAIVCFSLLSLKSSDSDKPKVAEGKPVSPAALGADGPIDTPAPSLSPSQTIAATPTAESTASVTATPRAIATPACADGNSTPARSGPWEACINDVRVVVARVARGVGGRLRVYLRIENGSAYHVGVPEDAFLAVDNSGQQYEADQDHSSWSFESYDDYDLPPGAVSQATSG